MVENVLDLAGKKWVITSYMYSLGINEKSEVQGGVRSQDK